MININHHYQQGYIALISMLIIASVGLVIANTLTLSGIGQARAALDMETGQMASNLAYSCLEDGLLQLKNNFSYTGGTISLGNGNCSIAISGAGKNRTFAISAIQIDSPGYYKNLQATIRKQGYSINLINVQEAP